jgi:ATP-binding cassette subfamily B protein
MNRRRGVAFSKGTAKNRKYTLKRLWNYLSKFKYLLITALILTITSNILALLGPSLTGKIMDEIELGEGNINFRNIYYFAILMGIFYISSCILTYIISLVMITPHLMTKENSILINLLLI